MHHLLAYYAAALGNVANTDIAGLADIITRQNNHYVFPDRMMALASWAGSATLNRVRFWQPSLRQIAYNYLDGIDRSALPTSNPPIADFSERPLPLVAGEEIAMEATSGVAMTEEFHGLLWVCRQFTPAPAGPIITLYGTSVTNTTADAWSLLTTTWNDILKAGRYGVVGLNVQSTNAIAARIVFEDQFFRPGSLSRSSLANVRHRLFSRGRLGLFGTFDARAMPQIEVLTDAANAAHDIYMDIVPMSGQYG